MDINVVSGAVVQGAIKVHSALGPGLLESVYRSCLVHELRKGGFETELECAIPVSYDGLTFETGFRADLIVEHAVLVELKSVATVLPVHEAQLLSYLRLSGHQVGLLINFKVRRLVEGIRRFRI